MAIGFAAARFIKRSQGHSAVERLAYITRARLIAALTGQTFDFSDREPATYAETLAPLGTPAGLKDAVALWNQVENASQRDNAIWGIDLLIALPAPGEMTDADAFELLQCFISKTVVEQHQLAATMAFHPPHRDLDGPDLFHELGGYEPDSFNTAMQRQLLNRHAHVLITPRQIGPTGLGAKRYLELDPSHRDQRPAAGLNWGRLWARFQNQHFYEQGLILRVRPNPPIPLEPAPLKSVRRERKALRRKDHDVSGRKLVVHPQRDEGNRKALETLEGALSQFAAPFTRSELKDLFRRHMPDRLAEELTGATLGGEEVVELKLPTTASNVRWYAAFSVVRDEMAAVARGLLLANRNASPRKMAAVWQSGVTAERAKLLESVAQSPDLIIINTSGSAQNLMQDLAAWAQMQGLVPVTILHAAGTRPPKSVCRSIADLPSKPISGACMLIETPDALTPFEMDLVFKLPSPAATG